MKKIHAIRNLPAIPVKTTLHLARQAVRFFSCLPCFAALSALLSPLAVAAPPDAGSLLQDIRPLPTVRENASGVLPEEATRPAAQLDDSVPVAVRGFRILGASAFSASDLQALIAGGVGQTLTLAKIHALAQNITAHYR